MVVAAGLGTLGTISKSLALLGWGICLYSFLEGFLFEPVDFPGKVVLFGFS